MNHPPEGRNGPTVLSLDSNTMVAGRDIIIQAGNGLSRPYGLSSETAMLAEWVSKLNFYPYHKDTLEKVTEGTGSWIFNDSAFIGWLAKESGTLWGTGIPGAGKTCLTSIVIEHLLALATSPSSSTLVAFIYCRYNNHLGTTAFFASLLRQLVENSETAAQYTHKNLFTPCMKHGTTPTRSEILKTLKGVLNLLPKIYIVVDGLDELEDGVRHEVANILPSLQQRLFMTSRPLPLSSFPNADFTIRAPTEDFQKFITSELGRIPRLSWILEPDILPVIIDKIVSKSEGMFLLAAFQLSALSSKGVTNLEDLHNAVDALPTDLSKTYEMILTRLRALSEGEQALAHRALRWVTHGLRLFKVDELLEVLAVDLERANYDGKRRPHINTVISVCLGLLVVKKESETVELIHYTGHEYLGRNLLCFGNCHLTLANVSAIYLSHASANSSSIASEADLKETEKAHPFFSYAIRCIGHHTRRANGMDQLLPTHVGSLFATHSRLLLLPMVDGKEHIDHGTLLHFAAFNGLMSVVEENVKQAKMLESQQGSPLFYACLGGHTSIVKLLLDNTEVDKKSVVAFGATALHLAAESGDHELFDLLICPGNSGQPEPGKPAEPEAKLLLNRFGWHSAIDINARLDICGKTALLLACDKGYERIVERLLRCEGIDVNEADNERTAPLHIASYRGHTVIVKLLLDLPNIDINAKAKDGCTPLYIASQYKHDSVVQLLLNTTNIDVNPKAIDGSTPFQIASEYGHASVIELLLSARGIDVSADTDSLYVASNRGHESVVRVLLQTPGIDILNANASDGSTPLHVASQNGHEPVVRLLLETPVIDINARRMDGATALLIAAWKGHESVVRLLLGMPNIDVNAGEDRGVTPLHIASNQGQEAVVRLLLSSPSTDVNVRTERGRTALLLAADGGHESVIQLLLGTSGIDVNAKSHEGWTPLTIASHNGHAAIVQQLLKHQDIDLREKAGSKVACKCANRTALQIARRQRHENVVAVFEAMRYGGILSKGVGGVWRKLLK